jgi:hypothetical protein
MPVGQLATAPREEPRRAWLCTPPARAPAEVRSGGPASRDDGISGKLAGKGACHSRKPLKPAISLGCMEWWCGRDRSPPTRPSCPGRRGGLRDGQQNAWLQQQGGRAVAEIVEAYARQPCPLQQGVEAPREEAPRPHWPTERVGEYVHRPRRGSRTLGRWLPRRGRAPGCELRDRGGPCASDCMTTGEAKPACCGSGVCRWSTFESPRVSHRLPCEPRRRHEAGVLRGDARATQRPVAPGSGGKSRTGVGSQQS